jgi:two-component system, NarL family, nitrate/nitrite response regulator NarL
MPGAIRVGIVDPHPLYRQGVVKTIAGKPEFNLAFEGDTASDAHAAALKRGLDILLLDIGIFDGDFKQTHELKALDANLKLVALTAHDDLFTVSTVLAAGVRGYILKGISGLDLVSALQTIYAGKPYVTPELASELLVVECQSAPTKELAVLTSRERQVLHHISTGLTNREVAARLGLHVKTIKYYLTGAFKKLNVSNRVQAMQLFRSLITKDRPGY